MEKNMDKVKMKLGFSPTEIISAVKELEPEDRDFFIENLLAATNPEYLESIAEARQDYREGRVTSHEDLFGKSLE